ncbi:hypothetical protein [Fimbriimonas ginsengisoli]|uniref:Uncharacterized protein n=1 Tax=Fimbriimonas ginsengisoli Gsoil 348 TaxID=661478 RepID=A0A068NKH2_FIMGI|nr:hypothetical protein [Fimbriimonas ginsengisoli]AIE83942.1 hypothetical protein OP10G_0574 [Fimbriimonas ginsengisoli Gsoil 348]
MVNCVRCSVPLVFHGIKGFHEGRRWGLVGDPGEGFAEKFESAVYVCPTCGSIEFFDPEEGRDLRADNPMVNFGAAPVLGTE